jgi:hypothetical protein
MYGQSDLDLYSKPEDKLASRREVKNLTTLYQQNRLPTSAGRQGLCTRASFHEGTSEEETDQESTRSGLGAV